MTPSPILKVLSSMRTNGVKCLLMGGQACVLYGGAEFSRDTDLAILADQENLDRLRVALEELQAECIAVPPFEAKYLNMGLAIHFRCHHRDAERMRIDVMSKMRGVEGFAALWSRRTTIEIDGERIEVLSLPDLVQSKKTQRDKDWPMITRLLEANYFGNRDRPTPEQVAFWLRQLRTPALLRELVKRFPQEAAKASSDRELLGLSGASEDSLERALYAEEGAERLRDRQYWTPLRKELARLRQDMRD